MKIQYCSDLHLEFRDNQNYLHDNPLIPKGEVLLLAGDIVPVGIIDKHKWFFDLVSDNFEQVYWIAGNHEYYHSDLQNYKGTFHEKIRSNVHFINNKTIVYKDVNFICSTLWSKISADKALEVERSVTDFYTISMGGEKFTPAVFNQLHETHLDYVKKELDKLANQKAIVLTHHVPSLRNYNIPYLLNNINEAFTVELSEYIETSNADYWVYGHHHTNTEDFQIGNTTMLTNQLGYVRYGENRNFHRDKMFEIQV